MFFVPLSTNPRLIVGNALFVISLFPLFHVQFFLCVSYSYLSPFFPLTFLFFQFFFNFSFRNFLLFSNSLEHFWVFWKLLFFDLTFFTFFTFLTRKKKKTLCIFPFALFESSKSRKQGQTPVLLRKKKKERNYRKKKEEWG